MKFLTYVALGILITCTVVLLFEFTQNPWFIGFKCLNFRGSDRSTQLWRE